jgi:ankyrin repeat protein
MKLFLSLFCATVVSAQTKLPAPADFKVDFKKDVQPILAQKCHSCHGDEAQQAGLRLDRRQNALRGGDYGPVILPGNSAQSKLIRRLVHGDGGLQMPPTGPLRDEEIGILRAWIDQGADFRIEVEQEAPPKPVDPAQADFLEAVRSNRVQTVAKSLAQKPELSKARDAAGSTALHHAAGFGSLAIVKLLLDKGADANATNRRKSTPLFWAIPDAAKMRLLIDRGGDVNARTTDGLTPAYVASTMPGGFPILQLLLEKGANPEARTLAGMTPLMAASRDANLDAMRLLLQRKVDVNTRNEAGSAALMNAAANGSPEAVRLLLEHGGEVSFKTKRNETALAFAATSSNPETVKLLLDRGADVNVRDTRGYSALLYAAGSDAMSADVVAMLLSKGADKNVKADEETPAELAAKRGDSEVARLLGAPEDVRKRLGTAAEPAAGGPERSIAAAVQPALALLERQSHNFIRIGGCNSCHGQDLPSAAAAFARDRGLPAPKLIPQLPAHQQPNSTERMMDLTAVGLSTILWELFDLGMNRAGKDRYTDAAVRYIRLLQSPNGNWPIAESRRPPMNSGEFQAAALAVFAIQQYGRVEDQAVNSDAIARATAWLESAKPSKTQDRAFRLMGLAWAKAGTALITAAAGKLFSTQRADGGWNQLPPMGSDAYATGMALFALHTAGKAPADPQYQKGVKHLLRTQAADGSWHVKTRSIWLQPYFESGFPYQHDQWISAAGTAWAVMALSATVEPRRLSQRLPPR